MLVGDLYQLPPVVTDAELAWIEERFGTPFLFSARSFGPGTFPLVELGTVFRQLGDDRLVDLLNAVREGALREGARAELSQQTDPGFEHPTDESLSIAVGGQIMMLTNDPSDRWVNGTLGTVGTDGGRWRPRPIEIAVVTDDGDEASIVINPTSDRYSASADFGLTTRDVQLAPLLMEAWPALGSLLAGRVPVGLEVDQQLAHIDVELKRNGLVEPMPLGVDLPATSLRPDELSRLRAPTALERARAVRDAAQRLRSTGAELAGTGTAFRQLPHGHGYLLARTAGADGSPDPSAIVAEEFLEWAGR